MLLRLMALVTAVVHMVSAQNRRPSTFSQEPNSNVQSVIVTERTRASLSCESGDMVVKVNFTRPFKGLMYAYKSRSSPCRVHGSGGYYYELKIPLKGCGTWQESPRVFVNNVTIRFHPALELEEDETKTVVCRYPPPLTPSPGTIQVLPPPTLIPSTVPTRVMTAKLSEVEILIIICLLLFLSLLTLGIGIAYFCLKRRNIHIVRKSTVMTSSAPPSQITKISSSNLQPSSSMLSSVLGHTVRIPRAIPYSVPSVRAGGTSILSSSDHPYEDYPPSTSTTETSAELSENSISSSSLVDDHVDASKHLLFTKGGSRSILSIPKAILRKTSTKWTTQPSVHKYYSKDHSSSSYDVSPRIKRLDDVEDQTITTVLDPENHFEEPLYYSVNNWQEENQRVSRKEKKQTKEDSSLDKIMPLYAQVDKKKTRNASAQALGCTKKQEIITEVPEELNTTESITKHTTVTTSIRKEVTETRILPPIQEDMEKDNPELESPSLLSKEGKSLSVIDKARTAVSKKPSKNILVKDMSDVYLTTTVETECRELKTKITRDVIEENATILDDSSQNGQNKLEASTSKAPSITDNWNVIIRQRKTPSVDSGQERIDVDKYDEHKEAKPQFDVTIRAIPPKELKSKKMEGIIKIPPLEMPQAVHKLKDVLKTNILQDSTEKDESKRDSISQELKEKYSQVPVKTKSKSIQRSVRWTDDTKDFKSEEESIISSSDSFRSEESLRERSSSEVLEVAPTLPSQRSSDHPVLERSSSEFISTPEDHGRWVGGVVPVLETLSKDFLANIPVVRQGGFFNNKHSNTQDQKLDIFKKT